MIKTLNQLDATTTQEIQELEKRCRETDPLPHLSLDNSLNVDKLIPAYYLYYEDHQLVSFLKLFIPTFEEAEVSGFTLSSSRGRGYFGALLNKAKENLLDHNIPSMLLVCDSRSILAKQMADKLQAAYEFTEYTLQYTGGAQSSEQQSLANRIMLKRALEEDKEALSTMASSIFDESYESSKRFITNTMNSENRVQYAIFLDNQYVGMGAVAYDGKTASINGYGIVPTYQGMGLGKAALHLILQELILQEIKEIVIDVNSLNDRAYRLYLSCGFEVDVSTDYYRMP